jgi:hypothetical protein
VIASGSFLGDPRFRQSPQRQLVVKGVCGSLLPEAPTCLRSRVWRYAQPHGVDKSLKLSGVICSSIESYIDTLTSLSFVISTRALKGPAFGVRQKSIGNLNAKDRKCDAIVSSTISFEDALLHSDENLNHAS